MNTQMNDQCMHVLLERVGNEHQHLLLLVQQDHKAQVTDALLGEARTSHQLQALHLAEVSWVAQHVNK